jgi:hypothetical protein
MAIKAAFYFSRSKSMDPLLLERYDFVDPSKQQTIVQVEAYKLLLQFNEATGMGMSATMFGRAVVGIGVKKIKSTGSKYYLALK